MSQIKKKRQAWDHNTPFCRTKLQIKIKSMLHNMFKE